MRKTQTEILNDILFRLQASTGVTETGPGSIARMFAEVLSEEISDLHAELETVVSNAYVSTAQGAYLDLIGELLGVTRLQSEADDEFRARIVAQVQVLQTANLTALRIRALLVPGVADVQFQRYTRGPGSFTCYVIPQEFPINNFVLADLENAMNETAAYGTNVEVRVSDYSPVDINIALIFNPRTTSTERTGIRNNIVTVLDEYMSGLNMGEAVIINEIIQRTMNVSEQITDMTIQEIRVNEVRRFIKNIEPSIEERFYLRDISVV